MKVVRNLAQNNVGTGRLLPEDVCIAHDCSLRPLVVPAEPLSKPNLHACRLFLVWDSVYDSVRDSKHDLKP